MKNELPIMPIRAMYAEKSNEVDLLKLFPYFVRKVKAEDIPYPLTQEWIEIICGGLFVEGDFRGTHNPLFFPAADEEGNNPQGYILRLDTPSASSSLSVYQITRSNGTLLFNNDFGVYVQPDDRLMNISLSNYGLISSKVRMNIRSPQLQINDKAYPSYPSNQTDKKYHFVLNNGTLAWEEDTGGTTLYRHNITINISGVTNYATFCIALYTSTNEQLDTLEKVFSANSNYAIQATGSYYNGGARSVIQLAYIQSDYYVYFNDGNSMSTAQFADDEHCTITVRV